MGILKYIFLYFPYEGKCQAWDAIFNDITDFPHDQELEYDELENPDHSVCQLLCTLYTCDSWLVYELNCGSKEGDQDKTDTLGPFAKAFGRVIMFAGENRK